MLSVHLNQKQTQLTSVATALRQNTNIQADLCDGSVSSSPIQSMFPVFAAPSTEFTLKDTNQLQLSLPGFVPSSS